MSKQKCLINGCNNDVYPQNEVDVKVVVISSNEPPICEDCALNPSEDVQAQIEHIISERQNLKLPF